MKIKCIGPLLIAIVFTIWVPIFAADQTSPVLTTQPVVRLWDGDAPGASGTGTADIPTLTVFVPRAIERPCAAVIVCPGGAYTHLAPHEGGPVALWLNSRGVAAFVLKYRLGPKYHYPVELEDVQRAIRLVRHDAGVWGIDPNRVGIIGFSAGGHLASMAATHFDLRVGEAKDAIDRENARPDLAMLLYPVITMSTEYTHKGSRKSLLGDDPESSLLDFLSSEKQVTERTPPCFVVATADDAVVPDQNSLAFAAACRAAHVPVEVHIFEHGKHGFGLAAKDPELSQWTLLAENWLGRHGFIKSGAEKPH